MRITKYTLTMLVAVVLLITGVSAAWWLGRRGAPPVRLEQPVTTILHEFAEAATLLPKDVTIMAGRRLGEHLFWFAAEKRFPVEKTGIGVSLKELDKSEFQSWTIETKKQQARLARNYIPGARGTSVSIKDWDGERFLVVTTRNDSINSNIKGWVDDYFTGYKVDGPVLSVRWARDSGQFIELNNGVKKTKIQIAPEGGCKSIQEYSPTIATGLLFNDKLFPFDEPRRVMCLGHYDEYDWLRDPVLIHNDYHGGLILHFNLPDGDLVVVQDATGDSPRIERIWDKNAR